MTLASRIAVMDRGIIKQIGTPKEVYEYPNCKFVASFIGSANMFEAEVQGADDGHTEVHVPQLGAKLVAKGNGFEAGSKIACAFRPEKILISRECPAGARNVIKGVVQDFGYFGKDSLYRVKLPTGTIINVNTVNAERHGDKENVATWEDEVYLTLDPKSVMLFDGAS